MSIFLYLPLPPRQVSDKGYMRSRRTLKTDAKSCRILIGQHAIIGPGSIPCGMGFAIEISGSFHTYVLVTLQLAGWVLVTITTRLEGSEEKGLSLSMFTFLSVES